ncbi:energy-coupling factor ABC transporter ATP-binding protein [bacterium]|nr:energy-coupling factor ABC transporter ATP-binding protein [bacterium]
MIVAKIENLHFTYKRQTQPALNGIDFSIEQGETVAFLGHTGAGKSTFFNCLSGIIPQFYKGMLSGTIELFGSSISDRTLNQTSLKTGHLFQDFEAQLFSSTAALEVAFPLENRAVSSFEMHVLVDSSLEKVNLLPYQTRNPNTLSGGQKQRLALASILCTKPELLLLDEPTTDLDPIGRREVMNICRVLNNEGHTILLIELNTEELHDFDRICLFKQGQIIADDIPSRVLADQSALTDAGVKQPEMLELLEHKGLQSQDYSTDGVFQLMKSHGFGIDPVKLEPILSAENKATLSSCQPLIELAEVNYAYIPGQPVLNDISFSIYPNDCIAFLGENGSGKTTLVKNMCRLLKPSSGSVFLEGRELKQLPHSTLGRKIGFVFQNPDHMIFSATVFDEIAFGPRNYGFSPTQVNQAVEQAIELVQLQGKEQSDPFSLTKGERQKIAVASILACRPEIIILDEPTTGLDYHEQLKMMELLMKLRSQGHTILIITHSIWLAATYCSKIVVMKDGHIRARGPARDILFDFSTLASAGLTPTPCLRLSALFGQPLLTVAELETCLTVQKKDENVQN